MAREKRLGVWMNHSTANLIEFSMSLMDTKNMTSKFTHQVKEESLNKSEKLMHNKEQHQQQEYYKQLGEVIKNYEKVLLFGPTDAKVELFNMLREDHRFENIKLEVKQTDKMTENQQHAFVRDYFSNLNNN